MTISAALRALGIDWGDIALMPMQLRAALARATVELMESFGARP